MSTTPPSPSPPASTENAVNEPSWEMVVFKVEDRIFHSFRHTFTQVSDVFEGMFLLPQEGVVEGSSSEAPIVLPGCKQEDFAALMKILHPRYAVTICCSEGPL